MTLRGAGPSCSTTPASTRRCEEIRAFGVTQIRQLVYWQTSPRGRRARRSRSSTPPIPPTTRPALGPARPARRRAKARGIKVMLTPTGPVPQVGDQEQEGQPDRPSAEAVRPVRHGARAALRRGGDMWSVWNEPNQPQFLMPQYRKGKPYSPTLYRGPLQRRLQARSAACREPAGQDPHRRDLAARQREHRAPAQVPARDRLPEQQVQEDAQVRRLPADGYAHHAYTTRIGPRFVPPDKNDVTIAVTRRLVEGAGPRRPRRRPAEAPEDLPDRVRHPVVPGQDLRRLVRAPARVLRDRRAHRLRQLAGRAVLAVPDARRRAARGGLPLPRLRERAAPQQRRARSRPTSAFANPLAVERYGATRRAVGPASARRRA